MTIDLHTEVRHAARRLRAEGTRLDAILEGEQLHSLDVMSACRLLIRLDGMIEQARALAGEVAVALAPHTPAVAAPPGDAP